MILVPFSLHNEKKNYNYSQKLAIEFKIDNRYLVLPFYFEIMHEFIFEFSDLIFGDWFDHNIWNNDGTFDDIKYN